MVESVRKWAKWLCVRDGLPESEWHSYRTKASIAISKYYTEKHKPNVQGE